MLAYVWLVGESSGDGDTTEPAGRCGSSGSSTGSPCVSTRESAASTGTVSAGTPPCHEADSAASVASVSSDAAASSAVSSSTGPANGSPALGGDERSRRRAGRRRRRGTGRPASERCRHHPSWVTSWQTRPPREVVSRPQIARPGMEARPSAATRPARMGTNPPRSPARSASGRHLGRGAGTPVRCRTCQDQRPPGLRSEPTPGSSRRCTSNTVADPASVGESWQEFFEDYRSVSAPAHVNDEPATEPHGRRLLQPRPPATAPPAAEAPGTGNGQGGRRPGRRQHRRPAPAPCRSPPRPRSRRPNEPGELIKGVGAAIVRNMSASLEVPTATSFRNVPAKLLEVNRKVINGYRGRVGPRARSASPT